MVCRTTDEILTTIAPKVEPTERCRNPMEGSPLNPTRARPHVLLVPMGTPGDLQPFIDLGCELRRRGYRVSLLAHENFAEWARGAGLAFVGIGSAEQYERFLTDKDLWTLTKASAVFARRDHLLLAGLVYSLSAGLAQGNPASWLQSPAAC